MTAHKPYHHGQLRQALLEIAEEALQRHGPEALSVRDLAERAGVSRAAPYRHFADKRALEAAVAGRGFARLCEAFRRTRTLQPEQRVVECARAILAMARAQPNLFKLMFFTDLLTAEWNKPEELVAPADDAFLLFDEAVAALAPGIRPEIQRQMTISAWSTVHGYATLIAWNRLKAFMLGSQEQEQFDASLLRAVIASATAARSVGDAVRRTSPARRR